jgi:hypothetical protein
VVEVLDLLSEHLGFDSSYGLACLLPWANHFNLIASVLWMRCKCVT